MIFRIIFTTETQRHGEKDFLLKARRTRGLTVRPELVEGWTVNPFMVRQAHHERLNLKISRVNLKAPDFPLCLCASVVKNISLPDSLNLTTDAQRHGETDRQKTLCLCASVVNKY
jgi:hypothetical protein